MKQNENIAEVRMSQDNFEDFRGSLYFRAFRAEDLEFTIKQITLQDGTVLPIVHVGGVQATTGLHINFDMFPRNNATAEDLKALPTGTVLDDVDFRIGYWIEKNFNEETGKVEKVITQGAPKWISVFVGNKKVVLSGEQRKYTGK